jgi:hypothetical protein
MTIDPKTNRLLNVKQDYLTVTVAAIGVDPLSLSVDAAFRKTSATIQKNFGLNQFAVVTDPAPGLLGRVQADVIALAQQEDQILASAPTLRNVVGPAVQDMLIGPGPGSLLSTLTAVVQEYPLTGHDLFAAARRGALARRIQNALEQAEVAMHVYISVYYGDTNANGAGVPNPSATADSVAVVRARMARLSAALDHRAASIVQIVETGLASGETSSTGVLRAIRTQLGAYQFSAFAILQEVPNYIPVIENLDNYPIFDDLINEMYAGQRQAGSLGTALTNIPDHNTSPGALGDLINVLYVGNTSLVLSTFKRELLNILVVAERALPKGPAAAPPVVTLGPAGAVAAGVPFSDTGSFTSTAMGQFAAAADYGDGTGLQVLTIGPGNSFRLSHAYARPGTYLVTVGVLDLNGAVGQQTLHATVSAGRSPVGLPLASGFGAGRDAFVTTLYLEQLGRLPEPSGLWFWSGRLALGVRPASVAASIWASSEHRLLQQQGRAPHISLAQSYADALRAGRLAAGLAFHS